MEATISKIATAEVNRSLPGAAGIRVEPLYGAQIGNYVNEISEICLKGYKAYPYLFQDTLFEQAQYVNKTYVGKSESRACIAFKGNEVIGIAMGIPLSLTEVKYQAPFKEKGYPVENFFYWGELVVLPEEQKQKTGELIYKTMGEKILENRFDSLCFCTIERPDDHPKRPDDYQPLDNLWRKLGFEKHDELSFTGQWREDLNGDEIDHPMVYWIRKIK